MANNYTQYARNFMLDQLPATVYISLHSADPTNVGSNEVAGTTRGVINLDPSSNGERLSVEDFVDITVPQGSDVAFVGVFDAATAGNFIAYSAVTDSNDDPTTIDFPQELPFRVTDISLDLTNA